MYDKRCHHKVRELSKFYLFIKHKKIYYAYFPDYKVSRSTGETEIQNAYKKAWGIYDQLATGQNQTLYKPYADKKRQRDLKRALSFIDQTKPLTSSAIVKMQKEMFAAGVSGKTINNYVYALRKAYQLEFPKWKPLEFTPTYRSCFPIKSFYGFWNKCSSRLHYLAFYAITTGCRAGEIYNCEPIITEDRLYLKINGTKTKNAVRTIPVLQQTLDCMEYLKAGFRTASYKESVIEAGRLCGYDLEYIDTNHIVFHSFRKMYKTLLESCNIPNTFIEYYMGHSQTNRVNQLYFIGSSADDDEVYPKVIQALSRLL